MQGMPSHNPVLFALFILAAFAGAWVIAAFFVSRLSGWHDLAMRFELQGDFPAQQFRRKSARMQHGMNYNNCLTIGASPVGFSLATPWLFRASHPPLFIPWNEISWVRTKILWWPMVQLRLGRENPVSFTVRETLADEIKSAAGAAWPAEASNR